MGVWDMAPCPSDRVAARALRAKFEQILPHFDERRRRLYLASEATSIGAALSKAGVTASGVVAVEPAERVEAGIAFAVPGLAALERLAFERRVEGVGECVVRAGADRAHGLADAGYAAGVGEGPAGVLPGLKWSSQHRLVRSTLAAGRGLRLGSSSRGFCGAVVECEGDGLKDAGLPSGQIGSRGEILAEESVGVLVGASLPGTVRVGESRPTARCRCGVGHAGPALCRGPRSVSGAGSRAVW